MKHLFGCVMIAMMIVACGDDPGDSDTGVFGIVFPGEQEPEPAWEPYSSASVISANITKKYDHFENESRYTHNRQYENLTDSFLSVQGQIATAVVVYESDEGVIEGVFCAGFSGYSWIFFDEVLLLANGVVYRESVYTATSVNNSGSEVWVTEFACLSFVFDDELFHFIDSMTSANSEIRLSGYGSRERSIDEGEKDQYRDMLSLMFYLEKGVWFN